MQVGEERVEWQDEGAQAVYMNDSLGQWTGIVPEEVFHTSCRC